MKRLAKYITTTTQIYNGKCYYLGISCERDKGVLVYNIESGGTGAAGNTVGYENDYGKIIPAPGVECTNGLNVAIDGNACVYYAI